jgi:hypothetical protein
MACAPVAHAAPVSQDFTPLFDGRSFNGWVKPTGADANNFAIKGGAIYVSGRSGWLHTEKTYTDFTLRASARFVKGAELGNSGIFMRSVEDSLFADRWPGKTIEIEARDLSENLAMSPPWIGQVLRLGGDKGRASDGIGTFRPAAVKKAFRPGDWNDFEVVVHGTRLWTFLNGELVSTADHLDHPVGHLGLQSETGETEWRNIAIHEHAKGVDGDRTMLSAANWSGALPPLTDGALTLAKGDAGLRSAKAFGDFTLKFKFRPIDDTSSADVIVRASDQVDGQGRPASGLAVRLRSVQTAARNGGPPGLVGDPRWVGSALQTDTPHEFASYDGRAAIEAKISAGVWSECEVQVAGDEVTVSLNGRLVSRTRGAPRPRGGYLVLSPVEGKVDLKDFSILDPMGE